MTKGYKLPAKWVIHTVGPVWHGGTAGEDELLASCYRNSLILVEQNGIRSVAFPSISTGAYRFPLERAAGIATTECVAFLRRNKTVERVLLVCFGEAAREAYAKALERALRA